MLNFYINELYYQFLNNQKCKLEIVISILLHDFIAFCVKIGIWLSDSRW